MPHMSLTERAPEAILILVRETSNSFCVDICDVERKDNGLISTRGTFARLSGGHGAEVVRDIWFAENVGLQSAYLSSFSVS